MNLVIDEGNTSVKIGLFNGTKLIIVKQFTILDNAKHFISTLSFNNVLYSSVRKKHHDLNFLNIRPLILTYKTPLPINLDYGTPNTLGVDRFALA